MALASSGQVSALDVYKERYGDGASPSGTYTLEQLQSAWQLPETPDNTDIFYGRGRPEGSTTSPTNITSNSATLRGFIDNAGGYSNINCDYRFRWRDVNIGTWSNSPTSSVSGTFSGTVTEGITGLSPDTNHEYYLQLKNIHDAGAWQSFNTRSFTTSSCFVEGTIIDLPGGTGTEIENLQKGDLILGAKIEGFRDTNDQSQLYKWKSSGLYTTDQETRIKKIQPKQVRKVYSINGGQLKVTGSHNHLIYREGVWSFAAVRDIQVGDIFRNQDGTTANVFSVDALNQPHTVYRMTLGAPIHTFYANGVLTHNVKGF